MKLIDARWTPQVNEDLVECKCGERFWHRMDRWRVRCPQCGTRANLGHLRTPTDEQKRMPYELRDGQGSLFRDTSERNKDYDGKCMIGGQMYWIAGWRKDGKDGKPPWLSLEFKPAQRRQSEPDF